MNIEETNGFMTELSLMTISPNMKNAFLRKERLAQAPNLVMLSPQPGEQYTEYAYRIAPECEQNSRQIFCQKFNKK